MDGGENGGFKASFTSEGLAMLKGRVRDKLKELMGDYSDDTLAEYATVLIRNGRSRDEVAKELHVFLGDDNDAFVCWLWDHLSSNLHLYFHPTKAVSSNDGAKSTRGSAAARGLPVRSSANSMQTNHEPEAETQTTTRTHQKREWGGIIREQAKAVTLQSVVANVLYAEDKTSHESHAEDKRFHKSHAARRIRSPDRHNQRKRSREDDERSTKRASHPVIDAPRRLLQFAVRDAVRPVQPMISRSESASKRLCSVVSMLASDSTVDDTHIRLHGENSDLRVPGATRALRAAAQDAEDVLKNNFSGSVFNRLGEMPTIYYTERSLLHRGRDSDDVEYENIDRARAKNQAEFHIRNDYGGGDAYMYDRETEEAAGSAPNIDECNSSAVRSNGLVSRQSTLPSGGGKESLVVGYVRGAAEERSRRSIAQGTHADSQPRPSEKILNSSANITTRHETRDVVTFAPQVPVEKKGSDAKKPGVAISHVNDATMTDKAKDLIHSSYMVEAQKASSVAVGSGSTGQSEGANDSKTVFVSNVHFGVSKDALSRHFSKFGAVLKTLIVTDGVTGQPTGSAYIEFVHKESAEQALTLNGTSFMSRILKVVRSSIEAPQQPVWPRASRGSPFISRLIRTAYPRPTFPGGAIRGRLTFRGGSRSLQWKREAADSPDAGKSSQATPAALGNQLVTPITRSFTYTRTEPKHATAPDGSHRNS